MQKTLSPEFQKTFQQKSPIGYTINNQLRADLHRFQSAAKFWGNMSEDTYIKVKNYFTYHQLVTSVHWHNQEEHFAPVFARFFAKDHPMWETWDILESDRKTLIGLQAKITSAFKTKSRDLAPLFSEYISAFENELHNEEIFVSESILSIAEKEKLDEIEKAVLKEQVPSELRSTAEWLLAGMNAEIRAEFFKKAPFFIPLLWRFVLSRRFAKRIAVFKQFA